MSKYGMKDGGKRQTFGKNMAIRDTADDKPRPDLISPFAEERQGHWLRMGAQKYAERNWEKGMPFSRCVASLRRHIMRYQQGMRDEDHL
ncbi:MAG TPA: dATP/dGTP diphosphohydrolase domain-containing protein, partial [Thermoguttaceae bacterium]